MKEVAVNQAVGTVLAHDLTQIIPGQYKGPKYKKDFGTNRYISERFSSAVRLWYE